MRIKMHQVIRIIVYAEDKINAREKAETILEHNLVGENGEPFSYGTFFDDDSSTMSGKARWGNLPSVVLADSKEGKKLINDGMKFTKNEFLENLKKVREFIEKYSDEELFEGENLDSRKLIIKELSDKKEKDDISMAKYYFLCIGQYTGSHIYLYDNDGSGIRDNKHLKNVLEKWNSLYDKEGKESPYKNLKIFVIPIDVHY